MGFYYGLFHIEKTVYHSLKIINKTIFEYNGYVSGISDYKQRYCVCSNIFSLEEWDRGYEDRIRAFLV